MNTTFEIILIGIIVGVSVGLISSLTTFHITTRSLRKRHQKDKEDELYDILSIADERNRISTDNAKKIIEKIDTVIRTIMTCNGYGEMFLEQYNKELTRVKFLTKSDLLKT